MDKTIESKFFEAFKWGGVVNNCIDWMRYTYNLPRVKPGKRLSKEEAQRHKQGKEAFDKYYRETLPKEILEATEAFDDSVILDSDSTLMNEIEENLNDCKTDGQRERYLFSLLRPFGEEPSGCGIARIYTPIAEINRMEKAIADCGKDKVFWQSLPEGEQIKNVNDEHPQNEQIEACNSMCKRYKEQIDWVLYVNREFIDLTCPVKVKKGSVEMCLMGFVDVMEVYANRLDALLLTYGIDLLRLQKESGLYLKRYRLITDVDCYIGSRELAQRYIDALPKEPQLGSDTQKVDEPDLPSELNTELARKYFAKAVNVGYMERTINGYKWLFGGDKGQARLGYFCNKVYNSPRPINKLEELFEVKKLSASITNADSEAKRADVKQWRNEINDNIFND